MTREEAIQYAKDKFDKGLYRLELGYLNRGLYQIVAREVDFMRVAIAALREQEERSKGCSACDGGFGDNTMVFYAGGYKHCPMCGRRLEDV